MYKVLSFSLFIAAAAALHAIPDSTQPEQQPQQPQQSETFFEKVDSDVHDAAHDVESWFDRTF